MALENTSPGVSIVLASYNGEQFIGEQIDSILNQDYAEFEVVICDDASTDRTCEIVEAYGDARLRLIRDTVNVGFMKNFERALSHCKGEYLFFCDQDDIWESSRLSIALELAKRKNALAVYANAEFVDSQGALLGVDLFTGFGTNRLTQVDYRLFYLSNFIPGCTLMINRELLDFAMPFPDGVMHDAWLAYLACYLGRLHAIDKRLLRYRQHDSNVLGAPNTVRKRSLPLYFRSKLRKLNFPQLLKRQRMTLIETDTRLKAMLAFESAGGREPSDELKLLVDWSHDRLADATLDKYLPFFQSDNLALQLLNNREKYCEQASSQAAKIRRRGIGLIAAWLLLISSLFWLIFSIFD